MDAHYVSALTRSIRKAAKARSLVISQGVKAVWANFAAILYEDLTRMAVSEVQFDLLSIWSISLQPKRRVYNIVFDRRHNNLKRNVG